MKSFYLTDVGRVRTHNEDSVTILKNQANEVLMVVADGMEVTEKEKLRQA